MESVHVLAGRNEVEQFVGGQMRRQRQLQEDSMHGRIPILLLQMIGQIRFGNVGGEAMGPGLDAYLGGVGVLGRDIYLGGGIVPDQGHAQAGTDAELGELADAFL